MDLVDNPGEGEGTPPTAPLRSFFFFSHLPHFNMLNILCAARGHWFWSRFNYPVFFMVYFSYAEVSGMLYDLVLRVLHPPESCSDTNRNSLDVVIEQ